MVSDRYSRMREDHIYHDQRRGYSFCSICDDESPCDIAALLTERDQLQKVADAARVFVQLDKAGDETIFQFRELQVALAEVE